MRPTLTSHCVRRDTRLPVRTHREGSTRGVAAITCALALALLAGAWSTPALAGRAKVPQPHIVWANAKVAYIANADSSSVAEGDRADFLDDKRGVATGTVTRVDRSGLVTVALGWSALESVKHLDRVLIGFTRPKPHGRPKLTIGGPAPMRAGVLWACGSGALHARFPPHGYSIVERDSVRVWFVRDTTEASIWPDTLVVRAFEDAADEEIALERGEVDAALFWPGELSTHMREQPRWQSSPVATRTRGALVVMAVVPAAPEQAVPRSPARADSAGLDFLNRFLFRGDLTPLDVTPPRIGGTTRPAIALPRASGAAAALPVAEVERDSACARPNAIERFFAHPATGRNTRPARPGLKLFYLDATIRPADSLAIAITDHLHASASPLTRARADSLGRAVRGHGGAPLTPSVLLDALREPLGLVYVAGLTCPMPCAPDVRSYIEALGVDTLADMIGRMPAGAGP